MADKKISALTGAGSLTGAEQVPVVQGGATVRTTVAAILAQAWARASHTGTQAISTIAGLQAALDAKALDSAVVKLTGAQTKTGVLTLSSAPVVPDASWTIAKTSGLQTALDSASSTGAVSSVNARTGAVTGLAEAPIAADAIIYVGRGAGASDANDGLSPGKPKATVAAALAARSSGGVVQMLAGTFDLTFSSHPDGAGYQVGGVVYSKTILRGLGALTILRIANSQASGYALMNRQITTGGDEGIVFEDFVIDGNNANQGSSIQHGITLLRATNVKFNRVWVKNCRGTAVSGVNESFHFDVQLCSNISYTQCNAFGTTGSTASGFSANGSTNISYIGCKAWGMSVTNGFTHNACVGVVHTNCHAYLNATIGFNSEDSIGTVYDTCLGGGKATTGNLSHPYTSGQTLGNGGYGFVLNESADVLLSNCSGIGNQQGVWVAGTTSSGRIVGGRYANNSIVGIYFNNDSEKRFKVTGSPIVTGNTSSPYAYTTGFANGPGVVTAPTVPASTVALVNPFPFDATVFVTGGTVSAVTIDGFSPGPVSGPFPLPFGKAIILTYTVAPTWGWYLQ